jgi:hypothetical protein
VLTSEDRPVALAQAPVREVVVAPDAPVVLWWTTVEGQRVVAVASTQEGADAEPMLDETSALLDAMTVG